MIEKQYKAYGIFSREIGGENWDFEGACRTDIEALAIAESYRGGFKKREAKVEKVQVGPRKKGAGHQTMFDVRRRRAKNLARDVSPEP